MKKTLITLALAATVASGSAMAWTANGTGGHVQLSGTLSQVVKVTPWEVKVGDAFTGLDTDIQKHQKEAKIRLAKAIPVLGIRTKESATFKGKVGVNPQIDFGDAIDLNGFNAGVAILTLPIKGTDDAVLGSLTAPLFTAGAASMRKDDGSVNSAHLLSGSVSGMAFFGGISKSGYQDANFEARALALWPDITEHFDSQGLQIRTNASEMVFYDKESSYSGYYASGIESGKEISIALESPVQGDSPLQWNASLPVTVIYL
nr:fimbrial protein [Erwinia sp. Ejp617]